MQTNPVWGSREISPPPVIAIHGSSRKKRKTLATGIVSLGKDIVVGILSNVISSSMLPQELFPPTHR